MEKNTFYIRDNYILPNADVFKKNLKDTIPLLGRFFSNSIKYLDTKGPVKRLPFPDSYKKEFIESMDIDTKELIEVLRKTPGINVRHEKYKDVFNMCIMAPMMFFWTIADSYKAEKKPHELLSYFLTLKTYGWIHVKYFHHGVSSPDVMDYTIENMSNRYLSTKFNTIYELLQYQSSTNLDSFEKISNEISDYVIDRFLQNIINKLNSLMKNIFNEYQKNHKNQNSMTKDKNILTNKEGENYYNDLENLSSNIEKASMKIRVSLANNSSVDMKLVDLATRQSRYSKVKTAILIKDITEDNLDELQVMIGLMIAYYIASQKREIKDIKSKDFYIVMNNSLKVTNTSDKYLLKIREILNKILAHHSKEIRSRTINKSTKSNIKRTIFIYFILYIQKNI